MDAIENEKEKEETSSDSVLVSMRKLKRFMNNPRYRYMPVNYSIKVI